MCWTFIKTATFLILSFCVQPSLFHARTTMLVNSGHFRCPSCRREVVLDRHGVYGLQRNLLVENIIDVYNQEINSVPSPLSPSQTQATCSDHEGEKLNIYCLTCQLPTCSLCKVFGDHQSCLVVPLADIYQQQKDELSEVVTSLVAFSDRVQSVINKLEEMHRKIEENYTTQKQSVCDKFNQMFSILEDKRKIMTQEISSEEEQNINRTQMLVHCCGNIMEANRKLLENAESSMEELDMAAFVENSRVLITRVMAATSSCPSETLKPNLENMSTYKFNFSRQERALKNIDFIKVVEDVPEELEVSPEPEEPKYIFIQSTELEQCQEPSVKNLDVAVEPTQMWISAPVSSPLKPVQIMEQKVAQVLSVPPLERDTIESEWELVQLDTYEPGLNDEEPAFFNVEKEKEREETHKTKKAPYPMKEENRSDDQEGMSMQQAVMLFFYLLAFLVILQRIWAYIGCFFCT
uniref:RING-type E3 ubiquitin transferase n=1 Tax=Kryptolebias marmoratus TaxID=37003 RepID=A0A3Q3A9D9_KRYMA